MKVKELIKHLKKADQDADVLMYSDAEGNSLHGLDEVETMLGQGPVVYLYPDDQYIEDEDGIS